MGLMQLSGDYDNPQFTGEFKPYKWLIYFYICLGLNHTTVIVNSADLIAISCLFYIGLCICVCIYEM